MYVMESGDHCKIPLKQIPSVSQTDIEKLNDELLMRIFNFLSIDELISLTFVCERWNRIIRLMPKHIDFDAIEQTRILQMIYKFPESLNSINFINITDDIGMVLKKVRSKQSNIEHLYIDNSTIVSNDPKLSGRRLKLLLEACINLKTLSLKNTELGVQDLLTVFPTLDKLRCLQIGNIPQICARDLMTIIMNCTNLISLKLYRINCLTDQDIKFMLCNPRLSEQLRELELDRVFELHTMSYEYILNCKRLEKLHINYSTGFSGITLLQIPEELKYLRSLKLERVCRLTAEDYDKLFESNDLHLSTFVLTDCCSHITDETIERMALCLGVTIQVIGLKNCSRITNINPLFKYCKHLKTLDLTGTEKISIDSIPFEMVKNLSTLVLCETKTSLQSVAGNNYGPCRIEFKASNKDNPLYNFHYG